MAEHFLYIHTHGPEVPHRAATPFYLATAAALMEYDVTMVFNMTGTALVRKGVAESIYAQEGGAPLRTFLDQAVEAGVKLMVCAPSLPLNNMTKEDLIPEVSEIIGGAYVNEMAAESKAVFTF